MIEGLLAVELARDWRSAASSFSRFTVLGPLAAKPLAATFAMLGTSRHGRPSRDRLARVDAL